MSVGDLTNNREKLRNELKAIKYSEPINIKGLTEGHPSTSLPIIHFCLLGFSKLVAEHLTEQGHDLYMKNDYSFMETVFKILRQHFNYRPVLTIGQFLSIGYAERKILMCLDVINIMKEKHLELLRFKQVDDRRTVKSPIRTPRKEEEDPRNQTPPRPLPKTPNQAYKPAEEMLAEFGTILKDSSRGSQPNLFKYDTPERKSPQFEDQNISHKKIPLSYTAPIPDQCLESTLKQLNGNDTNVYMKQLFVIMKELETKVVSLENKLNLCMEQTDAKLNLINGKIRLLEQQPKEPVYAEKPNLNKKNNTHQPKKQEGLLAKLGISNSILGYTNHTGEDSSTDTYNDY